MIQRLIRCEFIPEPGAPDREVVRAEMNCGHTITIDLREWTELGDSVPRGHWDCPKCDGGASALGGAE